MLERVPQRFRELQEITMQTDTRDILAHATRQSENHENYFLVDMDAHVTETSFWPEILALIDNDVIRQMGEANAARPGSANTSLLNIHPAFSISISMAASRTSRRCWSRSRRRVPIASPSLRAAPWTHLGSIIKSCSRRPC